MTMTTLTSRDEVTLVGAADHYPEGNSVASFSPRASTLAIGTLRPEPLAVSGRSGSGSGDELLAWAGGGSDQIAAARMIENR